MDMPVIDRVFAMEGGWVLNFSNRTLAEFFHEELSVNIEHPRWAVQGQSKGKRLRCYLLQADRQTALDTLNALWEYREATSVAEDYPELEDEVHAGFFKIIERLGGKQPTLGDPVPSEPPLHIDGAVTSALAARLLEISSMEPQARGYAFEKFLRRLFDVYRLSARASFRLVGEQIDGSFVLADQIYLLEAKWTAPVGATTLRAFNAKVEDKAKWSRGLFVSQGGFTPQGLAAFGRGHSVICMDGLDLHETLTRRLDFVSVLAMKARHVAETGEAFIGVRDLTLPPTP